MTETHFLDILKGRTSNAEKFVDETKEHQETVKKYLTILIDELTKRAKEHDKSKLTQTEIEHYATIFSKRLIGKYGSKERKEALQGDQGVSHHVKVNRHHPDHFKNGIEDMNLVDIMEMLADWKAASIRDTNGGDIHTGMPVNKRRYKIDDQLYKILQNTIKAYF